LSEGVEGHLRAVELSRDSTGDARSTLKAESEIEAKITSIERKTRRITLSVKALETELEGRAIKEYASGDDNGATTTLGEKLKEQLSRQEDAEENSD